jgi:hypothetical protein
MFLMFLHFWKKLMVMMMKSGKKRVLIQFLSLGNLKSVSLHAQPITQCHWINENAEF